MRIAVSGPQNIGKSTFIKDFLDTFSMYKTPEKTYRDLLTEKNFDYNKNTTQETQLAIREIMTDQAMEYTSNNHVIHDRCVLDNIIYSLWKNDKDDTCVTDSFIHSSLEMCRQTCRFYDIIFYIPICKENEDIPIEESYQRDTDSTFREEIDELFKAAIQTYHNNTTVFFDPQDCPAIIEIFGDRETRMHIVKMYIDEKTGNAIEPDGSFARDLLTNYS